jgi:hypothetical protein
MTISTKLITSKETDTLRQLIGCTLKSYGTTNLLNGTRTAIGEAFIEASEGVLVSLRSELHSYTINGVTDDFATVSIGPGDESLVDVAARNGSLFYDFSNSVITNLGIIRVEFIRDEANMATQSCVIDLGLMIETEMGRIAISNGSIWVNELDFEVLRGPMELGEPEAFESELADVWETRTTVIQLGD